MAVIHSKRNLYMTDSSIKSEDNQTTLITDEMVINDLETVKVLADPLRLNIIEHLSKPGTVKEVADKIGRPPTKLYYHFNLLEKHGLINMVETRIVSGIVEKRYQAAAYRYRLAWGLLSPKNENFDESFDMMISGLFASSVEAARESIVEGVVDVDDDAPPHRQLYVSQRRSMLSAEEADEFYNRLQALLDEFDFDKREIDRDNPDKMLYKLSVMMHPSQRGRTRQMPDDAASEP